MEIRTTSSLSFLPCIITAMPLVAGNRGSLLHRRIARGQKQPRSVVLPQLTFGRLWRCSLERPPSPPLTQAQIDLTIDLLSSISLPFVFVPSCATTIYQRHSELSHALESHLYILASLKWFTTIGLSYSTLTWSCCGNTSTLQLMRLLITAQRRCFILRAALYSREFYIDIGCRMNSRSYFNGACHFARGRHLQPRFSFILIFARCSESSCPSDLWRLSAHRISCTAFKAGPS